jgi:cytochrome c biogenesis protein CcdA/thiol-disulfide isomerase/thioredoxin
MLILLPAAFVAGLLTIAAPCTLPVVPLVLGSAGGGGPRRPVGVVVGFGLTFVLSAVLLAAGLAAIGLATDRLQTLAVVGLAVLGSLLLLPRLADRLSVALAPTSARARRALGTATESNGLIGGLVIGSGLGLLWAPCVGPIMAAVIAMAASAGATPEVIGVALAYVAGVAIPMFVIARWGRSVIRGGRPFGRRIVGALMLASALAVATGVDYDVQEAVTAALPDGYSTTLYTIEEDPRVQDALSGLGLAVRPGPGAAPTGADPSTAAAYAALPKPVADDLPEAVALEEFGRAPDMRGITAWINSDPLTLDGLRGKVVLVHFWTFGCYNCRNVQPYVKAWFDRYEAAGFTVLSVHTPELSFERDLDNVRQAVVDQGVRYPVAFDPDYRTWRDYGNHYWPAFYFVDRTGQIRHQHFGEGDYAGSEQVIRELLVEPAPKA